jgi:hypothetical protein
MKKKLLNCFYKHSAILHEYTEFLAVITLGIKTIMYNKQLNKMFCKISENAVHS